MAPDNVESHTEAANETSVTIIIYRVRVIVQERHHRCEEEPLELVRVNITASSVGCVVAVRSHDLLGY